MREREPSKADPVKDDKFPIEKLPGGIVIFDVKTGRIQEVNNAAAEMVGLPKDDLLGALFTRYFPLPMDGEPGTGGGRPASVGRLTRPDGSTVPVDASLTTLADNGRTLALVSFVDASKREETERELRERGETLERLLNEHKKSSESMKKWLHCEIAEHRHTVEMLRETNKFLKSILDSSASISIISTDSSGNILFWNRGAEKIFGYTAQEAVATLNINRLYPDDERTRAGIREIRTSIYEKRQEISTEMEELRESEKKYSTIVQNGNDGIVILQDNVVKFVNPRLLEMTGVALEEALGRSFVDFVVPEHREAVSARYRRRMAGEPMENNYEIELFSRRRGRVTVEISAGIVEYEGRPADLAIIRDVTDRKKAKEELEEGIRRLRKTLEGTIQAMAALIESRDPYTAGHQRRVTDLACAIDEIRAQKGRLYDPDAAEACLRLFTEKGFTLG